MPKQTDGSCFDISLVRSGTSLGNKSTFKTSDTMIYEKIPPPAGGIRIL